MSTENVARLTEGRDGRGRFSKGNGGRPLGTKGKVSRNLLLQVKALGPQAIEKLSGAVENSEKWAIEIVLRYALPLQRTVEFEDLTIEDVTEALKEGDITAAEAKDITDTMTKMNQIADLDQLRERIKQLEQLVAANGNIPG